MKLRHFTLTAGLLGAVITNQAFAVGLGEITLNSALNEPLDANIQLVNVGELSELEMLVGLGSQQDFDNAGVERLFSLTDLRFEVDLSQPGNPLIHVTSRKPIREPYLDFLVEVDWPSGRLLREYTLLLDMPVYAREQPVAKKIEAASSGPQPGTETSTRSTSTVTAPAATEAPLAVGTDEYRVNGGDTLWGIASQVRPQGATMTQTMAAIKQANPRAFINGNVNLLKQGAVLRLPEGSDITALSASESAAAIASASDSPAEEDAQAPMLDATSGAAAPADSEASGEGRLKLAALGADEALSGQGDAVNAGEADGDASGAPVSEELAAAREELDKTARENAELKERVALLEEQLATRERLLEIQDDSLRASQVATQVEPEQAREAAPEETAAADDSESATESQATEDTAAAATSPDKGEKSKGFDFASLMDYLFYPAIALLALLLALVMFFRNRKQDEETPDELSLQSLVDKQQEEEEPTSEEESPLLTDSDKEYISDLADELDDEGRQDLDELEELQLEEGEGVDPRGEADIYLSLGNYTQAENILKDAIERDPQDTALRLKLLEVYVNANNLDAFEGQRAELAGLGDPDADAKALSLRAELVPQEGEPTAEESGDFAPPSLDYDLGDVSPDAVADVTEEEETGAGETTASEQEADVEEPSAEQEPASRKDVLSEQVSPLEDIEPLELPDDVELESAPATEDSSATKEKGDQDFDLDLDLEDVDLDSLSSEIDRDMSGVDLGEAERDQQPPAENEGETLVAPESVDEKSLEELEDSILSSSEEDSGQDLDAELKAFGDEDECDTKLVLAETYLDMGDAENARDLLNEVASEGNDEQKEKAKNLLDTVS